MAKVKDALLHEPEITIFGAYEFGEICYLSGVGERANPYDPDSVYYQSFIDGYKSLERHERNLLRGEDF